MDQDSREEQTFTLTTGVDNFVGTSGNDTFNATQTATSIVLGGLDKIDGGAGVDTLNIADTAVAANATFALPAGFSISNVENVNVTTNGNIGATGAGNSFDLSGNAAVTSIKGIAAGTVGSFITASATANVDLTVAGAATATVTGGKAVSVTGGTGTTDVTGKGLESVNVKGGGAVTIDNLENSVAATTAKGTTLKTVTLDGVDAGSAIKGEGLESVTIKGATTAARTVTVTNAKANHELTVNVDGTGYKADGSAVQTVVVDAAAKTITVNATGTKSSLALTGSTATTTVNITGDAALTLASLASATKIDGSTSTGNLTLGDLNAATVNVATGAGNDSFALQAITKVAVDTGAGNDVVTLKSAIAAGSTINLGAGNDKLLTSSGSVATSTATAITVIDAGDGIDSLAANLINAGNAGQFKNFELINLDSTTGLDLALLAANNTLTGLTMSSASTNALYQNVSKDLSLTVDYVGNNSAVTNTLQFKDAGGTSDEYTVTFAADNSAAATAPVAANVRAGTLAAAGIETYNIVSGGAKAWNEITLGTNAAAQKVVITGDANLDLAFAGTFGSTSAPNSGVSLIDGSAANGKLAINTTNVTGATAGLTVKGGTSNDTITLAQKATVYAGAGDDNIIVSANGGTIETGAGKDMVNVKAAVAGASVATAPVITTITDFTVGSDKLTFKDQGTETFTATKIDVSSATALFGGTTNALDLAASGDGSTNAAVVWFQYAGDTYVVQDLTAGASFAATDIVVKLAGTVDLSGLTVADFTFA